MNLRTKKPVWPCFSLLLCTVLISFLVSGCGNRGPLFLPEGAHKAGSEPASADSEPTAAEDAEKDPTEKRDAADDPFKGGNSSQQ